MNCPYPAWRAGEDEASLLDYPDIENLTVEPHKTVWKIEKQGNSTPCRSSVRVHHHLQNMFRIAGKGLSAGLDIIGQLEEYFLTPVIPLEEGLHQKVPLREIGGIFSGIAGFRGSLCAVFFIDIGGYGFMDRHILVCEIVVVFIRSIKILHFFLIDRNAEGCILSLAVKITGICMKPDRRREGGGQRNLQEKFLALHTEIIRIGVCLYFFCL